MKDIKNAVPENEIKLFADDTNVFIVGPSYEILEYRANVCLKKLESWFTANKLTLNIEKISYTVFNCSNKCKTDVTLNFFL